ncbi:glycosyltransferase family 2 protein [Flavihumibacter petaseus]|uniref:Putative glycosyltransferase n=1 Tax=Flavihumibacter petaseus NBRC 106054 TaxID=1220578 RepID=A0A0E9N685_9BACT|nr:glycosyltransferase family A protein [Flavihumibacter petaseus]GAO45221.1 putative glycosyltransferase [Flavihumibacter petaseus NBRC 106054]
MPVVSVLMTSYNRERYIGAAIESVLNSTYPDFELIITDDRSSDTTVSIAKQFAEKDHRIRVHINEKNLGDYGNRNKVASLATGKYLKYVDADDLIYPWGLELMVGMMEQFPDAGWGLCSLNQDKARPFPFELQPDSAYEYHYLGPGLFNKAPLSAIIRKSAFDEVGGFENIRMAGDFNMWHKLARKHPVVLMPHGLVWYREHDSQEMNDYHRYLQVYQGIIRKYLVENDCPLSPEKIQKALVRLRSSYKREMLRGIATLNKTRALENFRLYRQL